MTVVRHVDGLFRRKLGGEIDIIHTARTADRPFSGTIKILRTASAVEAVKCLAEIWEEVKTWEKSN